MPPPGAALRCRDDRRRDLVLHLFPVAGVAYELIKMCACHMENPFFKAIIWPGLMLQKLTTREPDASTTRDKGDAR